MSYVGPTLPQRVGPTMAQRASWRWANVICERWPNEAANQNTPLAQRCHAIWAKTKKEPESPPPLKQSTRNLSLGYTEIEKSRRALGQDLFCVIWNWAVRNFDLC